MNEIEDLRLILVQTEDDESICKAMMDAEHPLGAGHLVGHKLLYLITSNNGILGAIGFASAAMKLEERDRFISWKTAEQGKQNRD